MEQETTAAENKKPEQLSLPFEGGAAEEKEAIAKAEQKEKNTTAEVKKSARPRLFTRKDEKVKVVVTGFYNGETGDFAFAVPDRIKEGSENYATFEHEFCFSPVPYNRLNVYRSQSLKYNEADKENSVDMIRLRQFLWNFHLKDWNLVDDEGKKIELRHDPDGMLSQTSRDQLNLLPAGVLDTAILLFERKIGIG